MPSPTCLACGAVLTRSFVDLGTSPLSNAFLKPERLAGPELHHPLNTFVCESCFLVQLPRHESREAIFDDQYAYFSSFSDSWLKHAQNYAEQMRKRLDLKPNSLVVEIASNDGYLLRWFKDQGIQVLGVEPTANTAEAAIKMGIPTRVEFFGAAFASQLVSEGHQADLTAANNVLAHVPDIHDFVEGFRILLKATGTATFEFPHLLQLMRHTQFDTIYHEHFSYLSLQVVERVFGEHGLVVHDVEELPTHGGSLRVFASHAAAKLPVSESVLTVRAKEREANFAHQNGYDGFAAKVQRVKNELLSFLIEAKKSGEQVVGYGAPAKGNTLLNYCGVKSDLLTYTVDRSPHKQGHFLPGIRIPIFSPEKISETKPDYVLILPWNLKEEITEQMAHIRDWGGRFVVPIPNLEIL
jgi:C-methyltransferase C-terminal domain/Putative zinc binding domain/Methyltransferase domain